MMLVFFYSVSSNLLLNADTGDKMWEKCGEKIMEAE